jgi:Flp pilus assembly pilin Flp
MPHDNGLHTPLRRLHREELGAQAAEYAMLGGVSAAACGTLVALLKNKAVLARFFEAVLQGLANVVGGWF